MAGGNKKKKKPMANPARGFATTSIASKVKPESSVETSIDASENVSTAAASTPATSEDTQSHSDTVSKDMPTRGLHELSPEELEAQLEQSELQQTVEQHGPKVRKEAARQSSRLQTDRRVLRTQAEYLSVKDWLPEELMQQILDLTSEESSSESPPAANTEPLRGMSDDALLPRIWQLYLVLRDLDLTEERVTQTLERVLSQPPFKPSANQTWGLDEAFDWLTVHCEAGELLDFEASRPKTQAVASAEPELDLFAMQDSDAKARSKSNSQDVVRSDDIPSAPVDDIEVSDVDSDMEPNEMLSVYLRTKARLFERSPHLVGEREPGKRQANSKLRQPQRLQHPSPGEAKLQRRLKALEADVLFDQQTADAHWTDHKLDMVRQHAERCRLDVGDSDESTAQKVDKARMKIDETPNDVLDEAEEIGKKLLEETNTGDDSDLLGAMFDTPDASGSLAITQQSANDDSHSITRNFGKVTGMSPRRVLEDACRSRDSGAQLRFKMISPTTYHCRHAVSVIWSKDQEVIDLSHDSMDGFEIRSTSRSTIVEMCHVAAPEVIQSEGYVATAALFLLFASSPKEEKSALRLPPAFRDLWHEFLTARKDRNDANDRETVKKLRLMIREQQDKEDEEDVILTAGLKGRSKAASGVSTPNVTDKPSVSRTGTESESVELQDLWTRKSSTPAYQRMLTGRKELPMFQFRDTALAAIRDNQVTILCGETGCGKSTQMPSFILEEELSHGRKCKVYCTEPRRISAISLAQRVSEELGEDKGAVGTSRSLVGYAIRLESQTVASTRLVYATVGIVLRMLESRKGISDITHLVIDEVHERSIDTDFLLIVLRSLMVSRPDLKVVLMSATVDAQRFSQYLGNAPIVTVPGRTFPVQPYFLEDAIEASGYSNDESSRPDRTADEEDVEDEARQDTAAGVGKQLKGYSQRTVKTLATYDEYRIDYDLIVKLLETVGYSQRFQDFSKAVLVFLPGIAEIRQMYDILGGHPSFSQGWLIHPLHSTFSSEDQQAAFKVPPGNMRKIVLATNIAETGITIPDVTCVIDTGTHKEMRFDERRQMSRLIQSFVSRANAKQRRGRAGRVQEGICFHLFTKYRHDQVMADQQTPEMLRLSLQDLVMRVKICKLGDIEQALSSALDPPALKNIRRAIDALVEVGALTTGEELTAFGQQLAKLPLDAHLGKLILMGHAFGCLDFALTTAAISSSKSPFLAPMNAKKQADTVRLGFKRGDSDPLTAYNAYLAWRRTCMTAGLSEFQFCKRNFLSSPNLVNIEELKSQLLSSLADAGFVNLSSEERTALSRVRQSGRTRTFVPIPAAHNAGDDDDLLINSVTAWSFYPKILTREGKGWRNIGNNQSISLHPTSVNKLSTSPSLDVTKYLSFYSIMQSSSRFTNAQETSPVEAMALVLLAGDAVFHTYAGVIVIDGNRLRFKVKDWRTMLVLRTLRARVKEILARGFKTPGRELGQKQKVWFEIFVGMFERVNGLRVGKR